MDTAAGPSVLLVEDELLVLELLREALEEAGYAVQATHSAAEALREIEANGSKLSALVTDIRLREATNGWDLAARVREVNATVAVVYMTGDSAHEWNSRGVPLSTVIMKPMAPSQVIVAIASLLNRTDDSA